MKSTPVILPNDFYNSILINDLDDSSMSFTIYIINPKLESRIRYSYAPSNSSTCYSSSIFSYTNSLQYMLVDFSAMSSQYGRFIAQQGFKMIHYPKLLQSNGDKMIVNPSFVPELADLIHEAVSLYLYPEIHNNVFALEFQNSTRILENGPLWDFGSIHLFVVTLIEEITDNNYNTFMANFATNRNAFWETHLKQLQSTLPSQKQIELHPLFVPLSKTPTVSLVLTECLELVSTNNTRNRKDMHLVVQSTRLVEQMLRMRSTIFEEVGITALLEKAEKRIGALTVLPVFV